MTKRTLRTCWSFIAAPYRKLTDSAAPRLIARRNAPRLPDLGKMMNCLASRRKQFGVLPLEFLRIAHEHTVDVFRTLAEIHFLDITLDAVQQSRSGIFRCALRLLVKSSGHIGVDCAGHEGNHSRAVTRQLGSDTFGHSQAGSLGRA